MRKQGEIIYPFDNNVMFAKVMGNHPVDLRRWYIYYNVKHRMS